MKQCAWCGHFGVWETEYPGEGVCTFCRRSCALFQDARPAPKCQMRFCGAGCLNYADPRFKVDGRDICEKCWFAGYEYELEKMKMATNPAGTIEDKSAAFEQRKTDAHEEAKKEYRHSCGKRFDLLVPEFLEAMSHIAFCGCQKYGPENWKKGLTGENSGLNHALAHLMEYMGDKPCDYGPREMHLAQVAWNCMAEFHFAREARLKAEKDSPAPTGE